MLFPPFVVDNVKGTFCPDSVLIPSLGYMSNAIELSATYKIIKPHIFDILTKVMDVCIDYGSDYHLIACSHYNHPICYSIL